MEKEKINTKGAMKKILQNVKEFKGPSILSMVLIAFEVLFEVFIPMIMAQIINVGMDESLSSFPLIITLGKAQIHLFTLNNRMTFIIACGALMVGMSIISLFCGMGSAKFAATGATGFGMNLRQSIFYKVERFSFANLDKYNTASLVTRLTTDVSNIQMAYQMIIRTLVRAPLMLIMALAMAVSISPRLSIIFAVALPLLIIFLGIGVKWLFPRFEKMLKKYDTMNESTQEDLIGIRAVKAFVREDDETRKFKKVSETVRKLQYDAEKIIVLAMPLMQILIYGCTIGIVWFGGNFMIAGEMQLGDFSAFLSYVMQILTSLAMVAVVFMMIVISRASISRINEVYNEKIDIEDDENSKDIEIKDGSIDFNNVDFSYANNKDVLNLENINIHINSGETIGIIGATGTGKTTLVQLIPRLYDAFGGEVKVGGVNVKEYKLQTLRDAIGMVLQKNVLFSGTIKENLKWGNLNATDEEIFHAAKAAQAHDFIESFPDGYETELGQGGVNVSGGQRQRLCIARALIKKPKIMILDDSTSAVDTATDLKIREGLKQEFSSTTVLIIAQRLASVESADRIIVMDNGKINAIGTHEELLKTNEIYKDVYDSQNKGANNIEGGDR